MKISILNKCLNKLLNLFSDESVDKKVIVEKKYEPSYTVPVFEKELNIPIKKYIPEIHNDRFLLSVWNKLLEPTVRWLYYEHMRKLFELNSSFTPNIDIYIKNSNQGFYICVKYKLELTNKYPFNDEVFQNIRAVKNKLNFYFDVLRPFDEIAEFVYNEIQLQLQNQELTRCEFTGDLVKSTSWLKYHYIHDDVFFNKYTFINPEHVQDIVNDLHQRLKTRLDALFTTRLLSNPYQIFLDNTSITLLFVRDIYNDDRIKCDNIRSEIKEHFIKVLDEHLEWFIKE